MRKFIGLLSFTAVLTVIGFSCRPVVKKEVIVVKEPEQKTTTITLDKNGVKVESRKAEVTINKQ